MKPLLLILCLLLCPLWAAASSASRDDLDRLKPLRFGHYPAFKHTYTQSQHYHWLAEALGQLGYRIEVVWLPNKRLLKQLDGGMLDGDFARHSDVSARFSNLVAVPEPFAHLCYMGFKWPERPLPAADKRVVGTFFDWHYAEEAAKVYWPDAEHFSIRNMGSAVKMLRTTHLDLLFIPSLKAAFIEQQTGIKLEPATEVISEFDTYVHLHKSYRRLADQLAEQLRATRPKGLKGGC